MISLALRLLPYVLVLFGLLIMISGVAAMFGEQIDEPVALTQAELTETPLDQWPAWVEVETTLDWGRALVIASESQDGSSEENEVALVPTYPTTDEQAQPQTAVIVELPWSRVEADFPAAAAGFEENAPPSSDADLTALTKPVTVTFAPKDATTAYFRSIKKQAVTRLAGDAANVALVRPDTKPVNPSDGPGILLIGLLATAGGGFWVYRRFTRPSRRDVAAQGFAEGVMKAVDEEHAKRQQAEAEAEPEAEQRKKETVA